MHINPYLIIEDEKYLVDDFKFGFRQKPNAAGVPIEVPVFEGLHVVIRGHYPGFFLERWACASNQSKLVELVLKPLVLGSGPTRVFTFFDAHLVDFTKNYSEKKNPPVEMILKITAGGVRDSFSKSEYSSRWRETFEKRCTVLVPEITVKPQNSYYKWAHSAFGNLIAKHESSNNYNTCNRTKGGYGVVRNLVLSDYTIAEIQKKQKDRDIFAAGRYQLIPITLNNAVESLKLDTSQKFDKELQDRIFQEYLISKKRPKIIDYLEGSGSIEDAMYSSAKEWASIGVAKGKKISKGRIAKGGESYYAGDGLNQAHITPQQLKIAFIKSKNE